MPQYEILSGRRYGRLSVTDEFIRSGKKNLPHWKCICDCGQIKYVRAGALKRGTTTSCGCKVRRPDGIAARNLIYAQYRQKSKMYGRDFQITVEQFEKITSHDCVYCGATPANVGVTKHDTGKFIYNGIDRIDNDKGYTLDNCAPCCETCNRAKLQMSKEEFLNWIKRVYNHSIGDS